ncbi:MAG: DUF2167 domain-containing protein [Verrucomicrobiales bacterium]
MMTKPLFKGSAIAAGWIFVSALVAVPSLGFAQDEPGADAAAETEAESGGQTELLDLVEKFGWEREGVGKIGRWAEIEIPEGYRFTNARGCVQLMELYGNPKTGIEQGLIGPEDLSWCIVFEFEEVGYVKDDEKDELDADEMMDQMIENQKEGNKYRVERGLDELFLNGWAMEPRYNEETNNLEWGIKLRSSFGGESVNFNTKLLGRHGVMNAILICDTDQLEALLPLHQELISKFHYQAGKTYAEYQEGDKIAEYGLAALSVGGGAVVATKLGLFAVLGKFLGKMWKIVVVGVLAIGAFLKKLFGGGGSGRLEA